MNTKKQKEWDCLNKALSALKQAKGFAGRLATALYNQPDIRVTPSKESPDFVLQTYYGKKKKMALIGIEHFYTSIFSHKKSGTIQARDKEFYNQTFYKIQKNVMMDNYDEATVQAIESTLEMFAKTYYGDLLSSLHAKTQDHYNKVKAYCNNIQKLNTELPVKFGFCIEIMLPHPDLYYTHHKEIRRIETFRSLITTDIVHCIQQLTDIDFCILCLHQTGQPSQYLLLRPKCIQQDIQTAGFIMCHYCGEDYEEHLQSKTAVPYCIFHWQNHPNSTQTTISAQMCERRTTDHQKLQDALQKFTIHTQNRAPCLVTGTILDMYTQKVKMTSTLQKNK